MNHLVHCGAPRGEASSVHARYFQRIPQTLSPRTPYNRRVGSSTKACHSPSKYPETGHCSTGRPARYTRLRRLQGVAGTTLYRDSFFGGKLTCASCVTLHNRAWLEEQALAHHQSKKPHCLLVGQTRRWHEHRPTAAVVGIADFSPATSSNGGLVPVGRSADDPKGTIDLLNSGHSK